MGDNSTGASGSWTVQQNVVVCCDNIGGGSWDTTFLQDMISVIQSAGKTVESGGIGPSQEYYSMDGKSNTTCFWVCGGTDVGMTQGIAEEYKDGSWHTAYTGDNCNIVIGWLTGSPGICTNDYITTKSTPAWDSGQYDPSGALVSRAGGKSASQIVAEVDNLGAVWGPDAQSLANAFLSGQGSSTGGVQIVEGFMTSGRGESLLTFEEENFTPLTEIPFAKVSVTEEDYESPTAEFTSPEKIDLLTGMTYVLITGDPGEFGGIIIKREGPDKSGMYTYTCQDYMTRIMNNQVYAIYNKSKTVYEWITEILEDQGIPTTGLDEVDAYDNVVDPEYLAEVEEEEKENQDVENPDTTTTGDNETEVTDNSTDSTGTSLETAELTTDEEGNVQVETNPFKKKPRGIYDKQTIVDHIRTLIFDYGVHVRFYGDVTGYPIFKAYPKEEWLEHGWTLSTELGVETDYKKGMDVTNAVAQVGVKNIEALKPTGELYTASDLLGVKLAGNFGRIGILVDNPTPQGKVTSGAGNGQMYQDFAGNIYSQDQVISTNGYPACSMCTMYNGGEKPEYKRYKKYWVNFCPTCTRANTLKSFAPYDGDKEKSSGDVPTGGGQALVEHLTSNWDHSHRPEGRTACAKADDDNTLKKSPIDVGATTYAHTLISGQICDAEYCQFCGTTTDGIPMSIEGTQVSAAGDECLIEVVPITNATATPTFSDLSEITEGTSVIGGKRIDPHLWKDYKKENEQ